MRFSIIRYNIYNQRKEGDTMSNLKIHLKYQSLIDKYNILKEELARLIETKDYLIEHKGIKLETHYINKIGKYEYKIFEIETQILRTHRKIQMIQAKINHQEKIDEEEIEKQLDKEYKEYMDKLKIMAENIRTAKEISNLRDLSIEESKELKRLYIEIAKELHPDLNSNITEKEKVLWQRAKDAYEMGDLDLLKIFYEMAMENENIEEINSMEELRGKINFFKNKIYTISMEIETIQNDFPFNQETFLMNEEKVTEKQEELKAKIEIAKLILEMTEKELLELLPSKNSYLN